MIAHALCAALAAAPLDELRDIHGPMAIPTWLRFLPWLLGAAIAMLAALLALFALRKKKRRALTPAEEALDALDRLWPLAQAGLPRDYAVGASDAIRGYIEEAFPLRAAHRTTEEFLAEVAAQEGSPLGPSRAELSRFLEACDLAKFARCALPAAELTELHALARGFVVATRSPAPGAARATATQRSAA